MCPRVWKTFNVTKNNGALTRMVIQDLAQDLMEDAAEFFTKYFYRDGAFSIAAGVRENPQALAEARSLALEIMKDPTFFCIISCEDKGAKDKEINGVVVTELVKSTDSFKYPKMKTKEMQKFLELSCGFYETYQPFKNLNVLNYWKGRHLVVSPECRNLGIAKEIFKCMGLKAKEEGVPVIGATLTSYGSQKVAEKANWKTVLEVDFQEFGRKKGVTFQNVPPTIKYMILNLNEAE